MRHSSIVALALTTCLAGPAYAQLPDSPTGRGGNKIIELFKTGPESVTSELMQESFSQDYHPYAIN